MFAYPFIRSIYVRLVINLMHRKSEICADLRLGFSVAILGSKGHGFDYPLAYIN